MNLSVRALLHTVKVHMGLSIARPMFKFVVLVFPLFMATLAIFIYGSASGETLFHYVVLGSGFMSLWSSIVYSSASDVNRERYYGTLEIVFAAPVSFAVVLTGKIIGNMIWGLLSMVLSATYLTLFFRVDISIARPWIFAGSMLLVLLGLAVFSFFLSLAFTLSRQAEALMNFIEYPIYLICGFMFPVTVLPAWLHPLSYALPPTWAIELLRSASSRQASAAAIAKPFLMLILLAVVYTVLAIFCFRAVERKARINGKLGVY